MAAPSNPKAEPTAVEPEVVAPAAPVVDSDDAPVIVADDQPVAAAEPVETEPVVAEPEPVEAEVEPVDEHTTAANLYAAKALAVGTDALAAVEALKALHADIFQHSPPRERHNVNLLIQRVRTAMDDLHAVASRVAAVAADLTS